MPVPFPVEDWKAKVAERRKQLVIPKEWQLPQSILENVSETSTISVLDIPDKCGVLTTKEIAITNTDAAKLLEQLEVGKVTSYEVTLAFCKRAAIAHQLTNCLADFFYDEALENAKKVDETWEKTGPIGLLHGLPVSFKEIFNIANKETNFGYVSWIGNIKKEDGLVVKCIKEAGGIPFCKTNLAQGCMMVEGMNNVFGTCLNPNNLSLTSSGSTSGEGVLVKMKGSPLGIGTDAGGSVRLPAHSSGVYGFIPSTNRITAMGLGEGRGGYTWVQPQIGPLVNDVDMIPIWSKVMINSKTQESDPFTYDIPWKEVDTKCMTLGVVYNDNVVETTPPMLRVMKETVTKLKAAGHKVIEIDIGEMHRKLTEVVFQMYISTGLKGYKESIKASGEPYMPRCCGSDEHRTMSLDEVYSLDTQARKLGEEYLEVFIKNKLDVLLTPTCANPAAPHGKYSTNSQVAVYNCLGYAAGTVPIGVVDPELDKPTEEYRNSPIIPDISVTDVYSYDGYDKYVKTELYTDVAKFKNAPLSVQVVGRKMTEEVVVGAMKVIGSLV